MDECPKINVIFIDTREVHSKLLNLINLDVRSMSTWYRIFLPLILPDDVEKVIYLDCDGLINSGLSELWFTDVSEYHIAGVMDTING